MRCQVQTYSGFRLHERPRRFTWGDAWLEVQQVLEQWIAPDYLGFKVQVADRVYILKYYQTEAVWEAELLPSDGWGHF